MDLLAQTLDALKDFQPLPEQVTVHLDAGYDYRPCREALEQRGLLGEIAHRGTPAPIHVGKRWVVERTNSWLNDFGRLRRCTERRNDCLDAYLALAAPSSRSAPSGGPPGTSTAGTPDHDHHTSADLLAGGLCSWTSQRKDHRVVCLSFPSGGMTSVAGSSAARAVAGSAHRA
jgi:hypothetical protein